MKTVITLAFELKDHEDTPITENRAAYERAAHLITHALTERLKECSLVVEFTDITDTPMPEPADEDEAAEHDEMDSEMRFLHVSLGWKVSEKC